MSEFVETVNDGLGNLFGTSGSNNPNSQTPTSSTSASDFANFVGNFGKFGNTDLIPGSARDKMKEFFDSMNATKLTDFEVVNSNRDKWLEQLTTLANNGNTAALETLFNYYATKADELEARDYASQREDSQYQRLVKDLTKAGISPYILSGASPVSLGYSTKSYSGSQLTSASNNQKTVMASEEKQIVSSVLSLIGIIVGALIMAA